ncbi:MAG: twin-arginine translocation signal domain-containing protein [Acidobacteriota bacterium]
MRKQHHEAATASSLGHEPATPGVTRRDLLKAGASAAALAGAGSLLPSAALATGGSGQHPVFGLGRADRRAVSFNLRTDAATFYLNPPDSGPDVQPVSGDEGLYADFRGSFSKTLRHNSFGEVNPNSYHAFLDALESGAPADFENIPVGRPNDPDRVRLVSPQAAYAFEMFGFDGNDPRMDAAPTFASAETAAEMGELYWYALTRDVPFINYSSSSLIGRAVTDLNAFSRSDIFPRDGGVVTPETLFRGTLPGAEIGPFVSQFLLQPFEFGRLQFDGRYDRPTPGGVNDFMTDFGEWLRIQRGGAPTEQTTFSGQNRFISSMRALGEFVHVDFPIQSGLYSAFILLSYGEDALAVNNPYLRTASTTQQGFVDFGPADITHLVTHGPRLGLTGAWYQKWLAHRRLRPEVFAGRLNLNLRGLRSYDINHEIFSSDGLARIIAANETGDPNNDGLLPMGYPEGSPAHPAYPGGHSTFVAAAATILKAWFNEDFVIPNPVIANAQGTQLLPWTGANLTVGNELNKLVGNITHGRDGAGMHWRSDGRGNFIGERQALGVLADYSRTYNEDFDGFELTLFSGQKVNIKNGHITPI